MPAPMLAPKKHLDNNRLHVSHEHINAAIRWLSEVSSSDKWDLNIVQQAKLLGIKERTYKNWKKKAFEGGVIELSKDTQDRLSFLLGIMKGLKMIAPQNRSELAYEWFKSPNKNPVFEGSSIRDYLLEEGSMVSMFNARNYLDFVRGS